MPNRIIRDSCRSSETLDRIGPEAERLFWRLLTTTDDFGRFEADARLMIAACFPLRAREYTCGQMTAWYSELELAGLVETYGCGNGRTYGHFLGWERYNRLRSKSSKYPDPKGPDASTCKHMPAHDSTCKHMLTYTESESESESDLRTKAKRPASRPPAGVDNFDAFWIAYPRKVGKSAALKSWNKLNPPIDDILAALKWQVKSEQWMKDAGQFIPHPATWLNQGRWQDEPPDDSASPRAADRRLDPLRKIKAERAEIEAERTTSHLEARPC